jgi:acetyl-CoA carboxylase biotin carboxyl carrier protein
MSKGQIINMDQHRIKQLIDLLAESDLSELTLSEGGTTVTLSRHANTSSAASKPAEPSQASVGKPAPALAAPVEAPAMPISVAAANHVCSPLYGVLHLTPSPEEPTFVTVGSTVTVGQTLCIVEAMKMFHQVKATQAGRVDAILGQPGDEVESGQPLFRIV